MERFYITQEGYNKMEKELEALKKESRPNVIKAIAEARAHGDLSENAEYSAAKEEQAFIEAKIGDLEAKIAKSEVIDNSNMESDRVQFGASVTVVDCEQDDDEENGNDDISVTYTIVGDYESDIQKRMISVSSPMARALIGKVVGDEVEVRIGANIRYYEVIDIKYGKILCN